MHPFLVNADIHGNGVVVSTASLFTLLAIVTAGACYFLLLPDRKNWDTHLVFLAVLVAGAIIGARLAAIGINLWLLQHVNPRLASETSGRTITGAMAGAGLAALVYKQFDRKKMVTLGTLDRLGVVFPAGNAVLRIGCYFKGCCFGKFDEHFPWTITYPSDWIMRSAFHLDIPLGPRIPFPLFAACALALISLVLLFVFKRAKSDGRVISLFFVLYAVYRFGIEYTRDEPFRVLIGPFNYGQWFALICLPIGFVLFLSATRSKSSC
jgi:phosphatidylglycerol:prolipoprotein diacylglycerol transferase